MQCFCLKSVLGGNRWFDEKESRIDGRWSSEQTNDQTIDGTEFSVEP